MFLTRSEYDRGVGTFSPEGRLFQVEYAIEAIKLGSTAVGIRTNEGVILAVEKRLTSPLLEPSSVEKIMEIDHHIGCAMSGLVADARTLVDKARVEAQNFHFTYNESIKTESIAQGICDVCIGFAEGQGISRPYGVALLVAGCDKHSDKGPQLFHTDPSGTCVEYQAKAIGSGSEGAQNALQEDFDKDLTLEQAETLALRVLKQVMEESVTGDNVELASVTMGHGYRVYTKEEAEAVIGRIEDARSYICCCCCCQKKMIKYVTRVVRARCTCGLGSHCCTAISTLLFLFLNDRTTPWQIEEKQSVGAACAWHENFMWSRQRAAAAAELGISVFDAPRGTVTVTKAFLHRMGLRRFVYNTHLLRVVWGFELLALRL